MTSEIVVQIANPLLLKFLRLTQIAIEAKIPEAYIHEAQLN